MAQRIRKHLALELFPFLAVLVCVMGALILLVVVSTRKLRANAIAQALAAQMARENPQPEVEIPPAPAPLPEPSVAEAVPAMQATPVPQMDEAALAAERAALEEQWRNQVTSLEQDLEEKQTHRKRQQLVAASTASEIERLKADLVRLQANLAEAMGRLSAEEDKLPQGTVERALLEKRIAMLREQLRSLEQQQVEASSRYSVVAFEGKSGTSRRPILIECTSTGIRFQPEGVTLTPTDIDGFTPRFNPLLAGSLALIDYWGRQAAGPDEKPYVLLIVRPDGTLAYYIATKLLAAMKQPYGYELVTDDVQLNLPPSDPEAKAALEAAIERAMTERNQMINASRSGGAGGTGEGYGGLPGGAGGSGSTGGQRGRGGEAGSGLFAGAGNARPAGNSRTGYGPNTGNRSTETPGRTEGTASETGTRGGASTFSLSDLEETPQVGDRSWQDVDRFEGQQFRRKRGTATGATSSSSSSVSDSPRSPTGSRPQRLSDAIDTEMADSPLAVQKGQGGKERALPGKETSSDERAFEVGESSLGRQENPNREKRSEPGQGQPGSEFASSSDRQNGAAGTADGGDGPAETDGPPATGPDNRGAAISQRRPGQNGSPGTSSSLSPTQERNGHNLPDNEEPQYPSFAGQGARRRGQSGRMPYEQLQRRKWGPHEANASIGVEKPVEIRVDAEQMVVANELTIPIPPGASRAEIFDQLLSAVDQSAQGWGQPGQGFFWVPSLRFVISPGGNAVYERVAPLVVKSGLSRRTEYTLDRVVPAATEVQP